MDKKISYDIFYEILLKLREEFHKSGRLNDSNEKLDEIVKILVINFYYAEKHRRVSLKELESVAGEQFGDNKRIVEALQYLFNEAIKDKKFLNQDGSNIFQGDDKIKLQNNDIELVKVITEEISKIDFISLVNNKISTNFDIINECFGHFVRENFRNNKEDAQYMTPQEIVEGALRIVFSDLFNDKEFENKLIENPEELIIMDPTCGVGTLIIETLKELIKYVNSLNIDEEKKKKISLILKDKCIIGQDKVSRMVKLSKINMLLEGANFSNIHAGNSILGNSAINEYYNKVSFIITNPPFGAKYAMQEFKNNELYPIINKLLLSGCSTNIDSELILLDKSIALLKEGGKLLIVVPDSVVSAKGIYESFREEILKRCDIKAVIDLPTTTFAQAGTRTKTSIMYIEKRKSNKNNIFMAVCDDLGYTVKERMGVPVKFIEGKNQMNDIAKCYISSSNLELEGDFEIISEDPSVTKIREDFIINKSLTPSFYKSERLKAIFDISISNNSEFKLLKLKDIAFLESKRRKKSLTTDDIKHISLLHINTDGTINFDEVEKFEPTSKGNMCFENDVLFAKLNPRIPRITVVPKYDKQLVCSNEFEILTPKQGISPYLIYQILTLESVRNQIECLTTGTSSSHNRIKDTQLAEIVIPFPDLESNAFKELEQIASNIEECFKNKYILEKRLKENNKLIERILYK